MNNLLLAYMIRDNQPYGEVVSNCCCEKVIPDTDICGKCKEHCTPIYI